MLRVRTPWPMSYSYTHLLIPTRYDFVPSASVVTAVMRLTEALGVIPEPCDLWVLDRAGSSILQTSTRRVRIPGCKIQLDDSLEIEGALANLLDYDVRCSGEGVPQRLLMHMCEVPLNLKDLRETLHVAVACHGRPGTVSMSDLHVGDVGGNFMPCSPQDCAASFTRPDTLHVCQVEHAGTARFWISVHHGNGLRPVFGDGFDVVPTAIVKAFEDILEVPLAQGGVWG